MAILIENVSRQSTRLAEADRLSAGSLLHRVWRRLRRWHDNRVAEAHLMSLDDVTLKDIGIHRSEIRSVVYGMERDRHPDQRLT